MITVQYDISFLPPEADTCALPPSIGLPAELPVAEDTPMWLFVSVKDTGPGLGPNELAILFQRFSREYPRKRNKRERVDACAEGNKMIHTRYGGSGLGLFICRSRSRTGNVYLLHTLNADLFRNHRTPWWSDRSPLGAGSRLDIQVLCQDLGRRAKVPLSGLR